MVIALQGIFQLEPLNTNEQHAGIKLQHPINKPILLLNIRQQTNDELSFFSIGLSLKHLR